jgi:hypothetical protein
VGGFSELSHVSDETLRRAERAAKRLKSPSSEPSSLAQEILALSQDDREELLDELKNHFCLKCGRDGDGACWCDYDSVIDGDCE